MKYFNPNTLELYMCTHMYTHACTHAHTHTSLLLSAKLLHSLNFECTMMLFHCFLVILEFYVFKIWCGEDGSSGRGTCPSTWWPEWIPRTYMANVENLPLRSCCALAPMLGQMQHRINTTMLNFLKEIPCIFACFPMSRTTSLFLMDLYI